MVRLYCCGLSLVVKPQPSKLMMRVRFPQPAFHSSCELTLKVRSAKAGSELMAVHQGLRHQQHQAAAAHRDGVAPHHLRLRG
ncbi:MAG: hypothetical protein RLZZ54_2738 [Cyanobacteriota bacterium]